MSDIADFFEPDRRSKFGGHNGIEECLIRTTATALGDTVWVTLPNSASPEARYDIDYWRLQVGLDSGDLVPRWPTEGRTGIVLHMDTGEKWLIY